VHEDRIAEVLRAEQDREVCLDTLIEDAKRGGGGDNITLAIAWIDAPAGRPAARVSGAVSATPVGLRAWFAS